MILKKGVVMTVESNTGYDPNVKMFFVLREKANGPSAVVTHTDGKDFATAVQWMQELKSRSDGAYTIAVDVCMELCRLTSDEVAKMVVAVSRQRSHAA